MIFVITLSVCFQPVLDLQRPQVMTRVKRRSVATFVNNYRISCSCGHGIGEVINARTHISLGEWSQHLVLISLGHGATTSTTHQCCIELGITVRACHGPPGDDETGGSQSILISDVSGTKPVTWLTNMKGEMTISTHRRRS